MQTIRRVVETTIWLLLACPAVGLFAEESASLQIIIAARQPADAPVIFDAKLTNTTKADISGDFEWSLTYLAMLTGPDGVARQVAVTNGAQIEGSFGPSPALKPGMAATTPLRLTNCRGSNATRCLPSEQVYLPPGKYKLDLKRTGPGGEQRGGVLAKATVRFEVIRDATLREERVKELQKMQIDRPRFAKHVLEDTLTPEIRRRWYKEIEHDDLRMASWKVYTLSVIADAPPDVMPALVEALKTFVHHPDPNNKKVNSLLNNAAYAILNHRPPGAGPALLTLATGKFYSSSRTPALQALRHYYQDDMAEQLVPILQEDDKWLPIYAARLLAWAGDDRGADVLAYLPNHAMAAKTLEESLASENAEFVQRLKLVINKQAPARALKK